MTPASQTHNITGAGSGHEYAGKKGLGSRARAEKDMIATCIS
jgi:hypothetical protein